jgi:CDP-6-deoxy-D-xylo-4-hexulose-3-dehydrase
MFYALAASSWGQEEIDAMQQVISGGFFTMSENVKAFEHEFATYFGKRYGVMVNSGSSANLIAVAALCYKKDRPLQRGDEVIVPAISWATTYHPLQQYGLKLRFVDVDLHTLNIDETQLEAALTPGTRAIVTVSILGNPVAQDVIRAFADKHGLYFIDDNCESMGAEVNGRPTGTLGDLNTFSFFFSHHISTMEGGIILTDDRELAELCISLRAHGWTRDLPADSPLLENRGEDDFYEAYRFILPGYNVRPLELSGAIGRVQLRKLAGMIERRRENLAVFQSLFAGDDRFIIQRENGKSSAFSFTIILNPLYQPDRRKVFAALHEAKIGHRIITGGCFLRHDVIKYYDYDTVGEIKNARLAHDFGFFVGNHPQDLTPQIERLRGILNELV